MFSVRNGATKEKADLWIILAGQADMVIRYQGGNNAGHTVYANGQEFKLRTIPSGIISEGKPCVIGNGVVIDPASLLKEIEYVRKPKAFRRRTCISATGRM